MPEKFGKAIRPFPVAGIGAGQQKDIGPAQGRNRFPQVAAGKNTTVAGQGFGSKENDIDIPLDGQMLKSIIKEQNVTAQRLNGVAAGKGADNTGQDWNSGQGFGQHPGLITGLTGVQENRGSIGDHIDFIPRRTAIATADNRRAIPLFLQKPGQVTDHRRFAGAAHGQIANGDNRRRHLVAAQETPLIKGGAERHQSAVEGAEWSAQLKKEFFVVRHGG